MLGSQSLEENLTPIQYPYVHVCVYKLDTFKIMKTNVFTIKHHVHICDHPTVSTNLIAFEVGPSAGGETLLTAEALEF